MAKEETYHSHRAKKKWAIEGDRNTAFFHQAIIKRNRKNRIPHLINPDGSHSTTPDQITNTLVTYFKDIFTSQHRNYQVASPHHNRSTHELQDHSHSDLLQTNDQRANYTTTDPSIQEEEALLTNKIFRYTYSIPTIDEVHDIIKNMRSNAAPGPDGLNAAFYKSAWGWTKDDIYKVVKDFYTHAYMPSEINQTFISLIPKKNNPTVPQDYMPISLCNVIYKIITKSLANRIKNHLPNYVNQAQSTFIAHRHISANIIITQEIIHSFNLKSWKEQAFTLKIDLAKAFNRLEWNFISAALQRLGLNHNFINLIRACISFPTFVVLVNDEPSGHFNSQRGLRQGCALSPYLFVIAINELSIRLQDELHRRNLSGISLGVDVPPIHSLLFADDLILCGKASRQEALTIRSVLHHVCQQSGQTPNLQKSAIYFSKNVPTHITRQIKDVFPVPNLQPNTMHLGHPMIFSHKDKNRAYHFIYNKFFSKFGTIKANKLNHAGRL
jgi:hypothetical protein